MTFPNREKFERRNARLLRSTFLFSEFIICENDNGRNNGNSEEGLKVDRYLLKRYADDQGTVVHT